MTRDNWGPGSYGTAGGGEPQGRGCDIDRRDERASGSDVPSSDCDKNHRLSNDSDDTASGVFLVNPNATTEGGPTSPRKESELDLKNMTFADFRNEVRLLNASLLTTTKKNSRLTRELEKAEGLLDEVEASSTEWLRCQDIEDWQGCHNERLNLTAILSKRKAGA